MGFGFESGSGWVGASCQVRCKDLAALQEERVRVSEGAWGRVFCLICQATLCVGAMLSGGRLCWMQIWNELCMHAGVRAVACACCAVPLLYL